MIPYEVTVLKKQGIFLVEGDFNPSATPVNIPLKDTDRQKFIHYQMNLNILKA